MVQRLARYFHKACDRPLADPTPWLQTVTMTSVTECKDEAKLDLKVALLEDCGLIFLLS